MGGFGSGLSAGETSIRSVALIVEVAPSALVAETVTRKVAAPDRLRTVLARRVREKDFPAARELRRQQTRRPSIRLRPLPANSITPLGSCTQALTDLAVVGLVLLPAVRVLAVIPVLLVTLTSIRNGLPATVRFGPSTSIFSLGLPEGFGGTGSTSAVGAESDLTEPIELAAVTTNRKRRGGSRFR